MEGYQELNHGQLDDIETILYAQIHHSNIESVEEENLLQETPLFNNFNSRFRSVPRYFASNSSPNVFRRNVDDVNLGNSGDISSNNASTSNIEMPIHPVNEYEDNVHNPAHPQYNKAYSEFLSKLNVHSGYTRFSFPPNHNQIVINSNSNVVVVPTNSIVIKEKKRKKKKKKGTNPEKQLQQMEDLERRWQIQLTQMKRTQRRLMYTREQSDEFAAKKISKLKNKSRKVYRKLQKLLETKSNKWLNDVEKYSEASAVNKPSFDENTVIEHVENTITDVRAKSPEVFIILSECETEHSDVEITDTALEVIDIADSEVEEIASIVDPKKDAESTEELPLEEIDNQRKVAIVVNDSPIPTNEETTINQAVAESENLPAANLSQDEISKIINERIVITFRNHVADECKNEEEEEKSKKYTSTDSSTIGFGSLRVLTPQEIIERGLNVSEKEPRTRNENKSGNDDKTASNNFPDPSTSIINVEKADVEVKDESYTEAQRSYVILSSENSSNSDDVIYVEPPIIETVELDVDANACVINNEIDNNDIPTQDSNNDFLTSDINEAEQNDFEFNFNLHETDLGDSGVFAKPANRCPIPDVYDTESEAGSSGISNTPVFAEIDFPTNNFLEPNLEQFTQLITPKRKANITLPFEKVDDEALNDSLPYLSPIVQENETISNKKKLKNKKKRKNTDADAENEQLSETPAHSDGEIQTKKKKDKNKKGKSSVGSLNFDPELEGSSVHSDGEISTKKKRAKKKDSSVDIDESLPLEDETKKAKRKKEKHKQSASDNEQPSMQPADEANVTNVEAKKKKSKLKRTIEDPNSMEENEDTEIRKKAKKIKSKDDRSSNIEVAEEIFTEENGGTEIKKKTKKVKVAEENSTEENEETEIKKKTKKIKSKDDRSSNVEVADDGVFLAPLNKFSGIQSEDIAKRKKKSSKEKNIITSVSEPNEMNEKDDDRSSNIEAADDGVILLAPLNIFSGVQCEDIAKRKKKSSKEKNITTSVSEPNEMNEKEMDSIPTYIVIDDADDEYTEENVGNNVQVDETNKRDENVSLLLNDTPGTSSAFNSDQANSKQMKRRKGDDKQIQIERVITNVEEYTPNEHSRKGNTSSLDDQSDIILNSFTPKSTSKKKLNRLLAAESVEEIKRTLSADPEMWQIIEADRFRKNNRSPTGKRCMKCREKGHIASRCPVKPGPPKCSQCGRRGHVERSCPSSCCTNCGHQSRFYMTYCNACFNSLKMKCSICGMTGHQENRCPNHWRQYHLTIKEGNIIVADPNRQIGTLKPRAQLWCCGCAQRGHLEHECPTIVRQHAPTTPLIEYPANRVQTYGLSFSAIPSTQPNFQPTPSTSVAAAAADSEKAEHGRVFYLSKLHMTLIKRHRKIFSRRFSQCPYQLYFKDEHSDGFIKFTSQNTRIKNINNMLMKLINLGRDNTRFGLTTFEQMVAVTSTCMDYLHNPNFVNLCEVYGKICAVERFVKHHLTWTNCSKSLFRFLADNSTLENDYVTLNKEIFGVKHMLTGSGSFLALRKCYYFCVEHSAQSISAQKMKNIRKQICQAYEPIFTIDRYFMHDYIGMIALSLQTTEEVVRKLVDGHIQTHLGWLYSKFYKQN